MKYWHEFTNKYGFGDGSAIPEEAPHYRKVYVEELNRRFEEAGTDSRVVEYDRPGCHNWCLILRTNVAGMDTYDEVDQLDETATDILMELLDDCSLDDLAASNMSYKQLLRDDITEKWHEAYIVRNGNGSIDVRFGGSESPQNVGIEVHDGKLKVHVWCEGRDDPASINVPFDQLMDPDNVDPEFEYLKDE